MKKIFLVMILGIFFFSCSNRKKEKTITVDKIDIPYSMVEQSIDLDDSMSFKLFLDNGFDPNYISEDGETLLMRLVQINSLKSLRILLEYNVDLEVETPLKAIPNTNTYEPTKRAIDFVKSKKALNLLIDAGADINYVDNLGNPLIIKFIKEKPESYTEILILNGVKLDVRDNELWTPLIWAVSKDKKNTIKTLLDNGANINLVDDRGNSAIYYAYDENTILMLLDKKIDKTLKNNDGENILGEVYLRSISNSYYRATKKIIEIGGDKDYSSYGDTPFGIARQNKDDKMIKLLESLGVEE